MHPTGCRAALVWRFDGDRRAVSSAAVGGGTRDAVAWVLCLEVDDDYGRTDLDAHVAEVASALQLGGPGVGLLTAAPVAARRRGRDGAVVVDATVGVSHPTWAADVDGAISAPPGTINVVAQLPAPLAPGAEVNAVMTMTEAKTQALLAAGVPGTGTASDAVVVVTPFDGDAEGFGGPRSRLGARLARATHAAVIAGLRRTGTGS